jgi:hypothetical protein
MTKRKIDEAIRRRMAFPQSILGNAVAPPFPVDSFSKRLVAQANLDGGCSDFIFQIRKFNQRRSVRSEILL